jgi:hypothetical protein
VALDRRQNPTSIKEKTPFKLLTFALEREKISMLWYSIPSGFAEPPYFSILPPAAF